MEPLANFLTARGLSIYRRIGTCVDDVAMDHPHVSLQPTTYQQHAKDALLPSQLVHKVNIYQVVDIETTEGKTMLLYYGISPLTIGKSDIRKIHGRVVDHDVQVKYLMMHMSTQAAILASELGFSTINPEVFSFDRSKSRLVSRYAKVKDEAALLTTLKCQKTHLPTIQQNDMMVLYYGWKEGDILHVLDCNLYRVVV